MFADRCTSNLSGVQLLHGLSTFLPREDLPNQDNSYPEFLAQQWEGSCSSVWLWQWWPLKQGQWYNPQPGLEQVLQPAWLLQSGFTRGSGNNFKQLRWKCFIVINLPPSHAKSHLMPFTLLSPALMALSSCFTSWTLWHTHCPNSRPEAEFLFLI